MDIQMTTHVTIKEAAVHFNVSKQNIQLVNRLDVPRPTLKAQFNKLIVKMKTAFPSVGS